MPKVERMEITLYRFGKGRTVESYTRSVTLKQSQTEAKRKEQDNSISQANLAGWYRTQHSFGVSYRDMEQTTGFSHTHIAGYVHLGGYDMFCLAVANGGTYVKYRDLAIALDSPNNNITLEQALTYAKGTTVQARAGIAEHVVLTEEQKNKALESEANKARLAKDKVATLALQFDSMSLVELEQLAVLLALAIKAK